MVTAMSPGTCTVRAEAFNAAAGVRGSASATFQVTADASGGVVYQITFEARQNGAVTGNLNQAVPAGRSTTPVTAVPDEGYRFQKWSDESTANPYPGTAVTGNISLQAIFQQAGETGAAPQSTKKVYVDFKDCVPITLSAALVAGCQDLTVWVVTPEDRFGDETNKCDEPYLYRYGEGDSSDFIAPCDIPSEGSFNIRTSLDSDRCLSPTVLSPSDSKWYRTSSAWISRPPQSRESYLRINLGVFHRTDYLGSDGGGVKYEDASNALPSAKVGVSAPCPGFSYASLTDDFRARAVEAVPKPCYQFSKWSDGLTSAVRNDAPSPVDTNHWLTQELTNIKTLTAEFEKVLIPVSVSVSGQGSVTSSTASDVPCGSDSTWTITPATGWRLATVTVDRVWQNKPTSWTFTNVNEPHSISVEFEPAESGSGSGSDTGPVPCPAPSFMSGGVCTG
jgi:hypothetical protein